MEIIKLHDGVTMPSIDYWEDDNGIRHPIPSPKWDLRAIRVVKDDGTYLFRHSAVGVELVPWEKKGWTECG